MKMHNYIIYITKKSTYYSTWFLPSSSSRCQCTLRDCVDSGPRHRNSAIFFDWWARSGMMTTSKRASKMLSAWSHATLPLSDGWNFRLPPSSELPKVDDSFTAEAHEVVHVREAVHVSEELQAPGSSSGHSLMTLSAAESIGPRMLRLLHPLTNPTTPKPERGTLMRTCSTNHFTSIVIVNDSFYFQSFSWYPIISKHKTKHSIFLHVCCIYIYSTSTNMLNPQNIGPSTTSCINPRCMWVRTNQQQSEVMVSKFHSIPIFLGQTLYPKNPDPSKVAILRTRTPAIQIQTSL